MNRFPSRSNPRLLLTLAVLALGLSGCGVRLFSIRPQQDRWFVSPEEELARPATALVPDRDHCIRGKVQRDAFMGSPSVGASVQFEKDGLPLYLTESDTQGHFAWCNTAALERFSLPVRVVLRVSAKGLRSEAESFLWTGEANPLPLVITLRPEPETSIRLLGVHDARPFGRVSSNGT